MANEYLNGVLSRMGGDAAAAKAVAHAIGAKSAAGYEALWNLIPGAPGEKYDPSEHVDATAAKLGPQSLSAAGQKSLHEAMDAGSGFMKNTGIGPLADSLSSKYSAVQNAAEPLVQKYLGVPAAAATHAAFETLPYAGMPSGEEKAVASAATDAARTLAPSAKIRQVAADYMQGTGRPYTPPSAPLKVDPERSTAIASAFDDMPHNPTDPKTAASYDAMIKETMAQYQAAKAAGLKVEFNPGADSPYGDNIKGALHDIHDNNHLYVYPTDTSAGGGFGSSAVDTSNHPMLQQSGESFNGVPATNNDVFRAVHDYFGHAKEGNTFRANGEENAWGQHAAMYSPEARPAMTTETRGQNSWVNFGPHGDFNRTASGGDTIYAPQKVGLLPDEFNHPPGEQDAGNPMAAESPLVFPATDQGRVHLNSLPSALEREGEAARRDAADAAPQQPAPDLGPMPPHNDSWVGSQAFAEGGIVADALKVASKLPADDGMMHFLHMSNLKDPEVTLDSKFYGSGMKGAEARRGGTKTISVYPWDIDPTQVEQPLQGKTPYKVSVPSGAMYDMSADPSGFRESEPSYSDAEDAIKAAGYAGYHTPDHANPLMRGQGRLFGQVPATRVGPVADVSPAEEDLSAGFAEGGEVGLLGDALKTVSRLPTPYALKAKYADNPQAIDNFHNWAKQTAVANTDLGGEPKVVYHNTDALNDFSAFRPYRGDIGSHFGTKGQANERGAAVSGRVPPAVEASPSEMPVARNQQSGPRTIPAYLSIQNPLRTPDLGEWGHEQIKNYLMAGSEASDSNPALFNMTDTNAAKAGIDPQAVVSTRNNHQMRKVLQDHGYDGIVYQNSGEPNIPPAIQIARQDAQQKRDAFVSDPANTPYWQARIDNPDKNQLLRNFPEQSMQHAGIDQQYALADEAYRRFYHSPDIQADSYVAFDPSQVKSAVGNTGEFDPSTQDINHAAGGPIRGYADGGGVEGGEMGMLGDAVKMVSHLPIEPTAAEAAPLAEHVAQYGGATYSPSSGALHNSGTVTADPASTVALDHAPDPDEIHNFMMHNQHALGEDPQAVLHITSDDKGNHFMRTGTHLRCRL